MTNLNIEIENCNSIDKAKITLVKETLNIKYGPNGLGKSTIAKAILATATPDGNMNDLEPFKHRGKLDAPKPTITGLDGITSALVFDEEYVSQFVFQPDEVVRNSFDIFIKSPDYIEATAEIETLFAGIRQAFAGNAEIEQTIKDLKELRDAFGTKTKSGGIPKSSKVIKAYGSGNKVENIPEPLLPFEPFIHSQEPSKWIAWQIKGNEFLQLADRCPYCSTPLPDGQTKETALAVAQEYDATAVSHLNALKAVIERLGKYFSGQCRENIEKITKGKTELTPVDESFLSGLRTDIEALIVMLDSLKGISFFSLRDVDAIDAKLQGLKIDLGMIAKLDSNETRNVTNPINAQIDALIHQLTPLKACIGKQKTRIRKAIEANQESINSFLRSAGYKYAVTITEEPNSYKMKLAHRDRNEFIPSASKHLSYGEKNAFALVLFMHQVLSENPDIVILDDPISSFDKNKKFAILHELFRGKASLKNRTTLMLTHDIEPAIDLIKSTASLFAGANPKASFLSSRAGIVKEVPIESDDLQTFAGICKSVMAGASDDIIKAIYLRRHFEIMDDRGLPYNLLASLFHKRPTPTIKTGSEIRAMTEEEKTAAETQVAEHIPGFTYSSLVAQVCDQAAMRERYQATNVGYEKIQLFRIIEGQHSNDVITKFINESYHIENEYVMQLNPLKFESVPEYVVEECDRLLGMS